MITAIIDALRAVWAYRNALNAMEALKIRDPVNAWIWKVAEHSPLSYSDTRDIHDFLIDHPNICEHRWNIITEFVIEKANCGHTADMILRYLQQIDMEIKIEGP